MDGLLAPAACALIILIAILALPASSPAQAPIPPQQVDDVLGLIELGGTADVPGIEPSQVADDWYVQGSYPLTQAFLDFLADPEDFPNPVVTQKREDHRCDRSPGPTYRNPDGNIDPDPFAKHITEPFEVTDRPGTGAGVDVFLHEGTTHWIPGRNPETAPQDQYLDAWGGWGYRHILAKHGWS